MKRRALSLLVLVCVCSEMPGLALPFQLYLKIEREGGQGYEKRCDGNVYISFLVKSN